MRKKTNELQTLPGVGPNLARDLEALDFHHPSEWRSAMRTEYPGY